MLLLLQVKLILEILNGSKLVKSYCIYIDLLENTLTFSNIPTDVNRVRIGFLHFFKKCTN